MPQWWESAPVVSTQQERPQSNDWWAAAPVVEPQAPVRQNRPAPQPQAAAPADDAWMYQDEPRDPNDLRGLMKPEFAQQQAQIDAQGEGQPVEVEINEGVMNVNGRAMLGDKDLGPWNDYWKSLGRDEELSQGYLTALDQERELASRLQEAGQGTSFTDQLTAPFNDELAGAAGYVRQGIGNLIRQFQGQDIEVSAMDRARAAADVAMGQQDDYARENPIKSFAGQLLGGFAFAPARATAAAGAASGFLRPTMAQAYGGAAATGGLYGVADARGGVSGRLQGGATNAALGFATAGLLDGGLSLASRLRPRAWNAQAPAPGERRISGLLDRALRRAGVRREDLLQGLDAAPEGALPLNLNEGLLAPYAEALAQNPGPGARIVKDALTDQQRGASGRIRSRVAENLGGEGNYFATLDNAIQQRRDAASAVMSEIEGKTFNLSSDAVTALRSEIGQRQIRQAAQYGLASPDPAIRENAANLNRLADTLLDNPSAASLDLRTAQNVSKALLDASSEAWKRGDGAAGQAFGDIGRAVRENAKDAIPEYRSFLRQYGEDSDNIAALEMGRSIFRSADDMRPDGMSAEVLRRQFDELSDVGKDMFRKGVGEAIVARAQTTKGDLGAMRDVIRSGEFADRIRIAFPDEQAFTRFLNAAENEVQMADTARSILNGSPTARRQAVSKELDAANYGDQASGLVSASIPGLAVEGARRSVRGVGNLIGRNRSILRNDELNETLARSLTDQELLRQMLNRPARRGLLSGAVPSGVAGSIPQSLLTF